MQTDCGNWNITYCYLCSFFYSFLCYIDKTDCIFSSFSRYPVIFICMPAIIRINYCQISPPPLPLSSKTSPFFIFYFSLLWSLLFITDFLPFCHIISVLIFTFRNDLCASRKAVRIRKSLYVYMFHDLSHFCLKVQIKRLYAASLSILSVHKNLD